MALPCYQRHLSLGGFVRSLPYTVMGLLFGLAALGRPSLSHGLFVFHSRSAFAWLLLTRRGFVAVTFGRVVITTDEALPLQTLMHEQHHAQQYEQLGLGFLLVYLYWHLRAGYTRNPLELAAARCAERWAAEVSDGPG